MSPYPEIQGGGSLILAWQVRNKHVLVIGGGEVRYHPHRSPSVLVLITITTRWLLGASSTSSMPMLASPSSLPAQVSTRRWPIASIRTKLPLSIASLSLLILTESTWFFAPS